MEGQKADSNVEHLLSDQQETLRVSLKNTTLSLILSLGIFRRHLPRNIPRNFRRTCGPRKFRGNRVSSEFRRKFPRDFRGKMNFRGVISEDFFRRSCGQHGISKTGFECDLKGQEKAALEEETLKSELSVVKERYSDLVKESSLDKQLLEASKESLKEEIHDNGSGRTQSLPSIADTDSITKT
ncbi:hypothetical protein YC2023_010229 [Brassica napus]